MQSSSTNRLAKSTATSKCSASDKFDFGKNWARFLTALDETRVNEAERSVAALLHRDHLRLQRFLDAGSGSGLFSLAAHRMGAIVTSFDANAECVACARELKSRFAHERPPWIIRQGSVIDAGFLAPLGEFDIVYCWGVVHHTGDMWQAIENLIPLVARCGVLALAIYNDEQYITRSWRVVKQVYQKLPPVLRPAWVLAIGGIGCMKRALVTLLACLLRLVTLRNPLIPLVNWFREGTNRGMHPWYDLVDWVGGWPFEVARPEEVFRFLRDRGFLLQELVTSGGSGCNQFVFVRMTDAPQQSSDGASVA